MVPIIYIYMINKLNIKKLLYFSKLFTSKRRQKIKYNPFVLCNDLQLLVKP